MQGCGGKIEGFEGGVGGLRLEEVQGYMNAVWVSSIVLLCILVAGALLLSQLDNATTGKIYGAVSQMIHIDLKALQIDTVQIKP